MGKKKASPEEQLKASVEKFKEEYLYYFKVLREGSTDRFYADGVALDLVRNHLLFYASEILWICERNNLPIPKCVGAFIPCKMPSNFLVRGGAHLKDKLRYMYAKECLHWSDIPVCLRFHSLNRKWRGTGFHQCRLKEGLRYDK